jgi:replicative DNA helicase
MIKKRKERGPAFHTTKIPPQALDVEKTVLGSMLIDGSAFDKVSGTIEEGLFYSSANNKIFCCIKELKTLNKNVDIVILAEELRKKNWLEECGTEVYLSELVDDVATSGNIQEYVEILAEKALRRRLIVLAAEITTESFDPETEVRELLRTIEDKVFSFEAKKKKGFKHISEYYGPVFENLEKLKNNKKIGIQSGFKDLDDIVGGFEPGDYVVLAARPGCGKTSFMLSMAMNMAKNGHAIGIIELEMRGDNLAQKAFSQKSRDFSTLFEYQKFRGTKPIYKTDFKTINYISGEVAKLPIYIDDDPYNTVYNIASSAKRLMAKVKLKAILVDYIGLVELEEKTEKRHEKVATISRSIKRTAKKLGVPMFPLVQLKRESTGKRPQLSDLRESGQIEQDADMVLMLHRESEYNSDADPKHVECLIRKGRNCGKGSVDLYFDTDTTGFFNKDKRHEEERREEF